MLHSDYYIYIHRRIDDNSIFYVGKGRGKRCHDRNRNVEWKKIVATTNFTVEKIECNLDNSSAHLREVFWIAHFSKDNNLVNIRESNMAIKDIPDDICNRYFIDPESKSGLSKILKNGNKKTVGSLQKRYTTGEPAGWFVHANTGHKIAVHRIIVKLLGYNLSPELVVNHKNCNPSDNRIDNLEICSIEENNRRNSGTLNLRLPNHNSSGVVGVSEVTNVNKGIKYSYAMATWSDNGKSKSKKFSYNKHGKELAWDLAKKHRTDMIELFYKDSK